MVEVVVHWGPGGRIRPGCPGGPAGGAVVTVAMWRWDGYHRRVVTSVRLPARERGRFRVAGGTAGPVFPRGDRVLAVSPVGSRISVVEISRRLLKTRL